jgi:hypothetical protein
MDTTTTLHRPPKAAPMTRAEAWARLRLLSGNLTIEQLREVKRLMAIYLGRPTT